MYNIREKTFSDFFLNSSRLYALNRTHGIWGTVRFPRHFRATFLPSHRSVPRTPGLHIRPRILPLPSGSMRKPDIASSAGNKNGAPGKRIRLHRTEDNRRNRAYTNASASSSAAIRSSGCSRPIESRIRSGVSPLESCCSSLSCECEVLAGCSIRLFASPTFAT